MGTEGKVGSGQDVRISPKDVYLYKLENESQISLLKESIHFRPWRVWSLYRERQRHCPPCTVLVKSLLIHEKLFTHTIYVQVRA